MVFVILNTTCVMFLYGGVKVSTGIKNYSKRVEWAKTLKKSHLNLNAKNINFKFNNQLACAA